MTFKPETGDILLCRFPEREGGRPSRKARPVLMVGKSLFGNKVHVVYGTSQNTSDCRDGDFVVTPSLANGLDKKTKFSKGNKATLPLTTEWFAVPRGAPFGDNPKMGRISGFLDSVKFLMA